MTYIVKFTESANPAKAQITVEDQSLNTQTALTFPGKNYSGYAPILAENFLYLLENFASTIAPKSPVQGQLWFDSAISVNQLKVNIDGTTAGWIIAGGVKKSPLIPPASASIQGDLWVDTINQQLYLYSGSNWLLVGPQYSAGLMTGPMVEVIVDTSNNKQSVISMYAGNYRIAIISKTTFTPKLYITGFPLINQGYNLSAIDANSATSPSKFWGTASQADSLSVNGASISSSKFLRSDVIVPTSVQLNIVSDNGIKLGSDLSFSITTASSSVLLTATNGKNIDLLANGATLVHVSAASLNVGIGYNHINPTEALDVFGNITVSGQIKAPGLADSTSLTTGSITTQGGLSVSKSSTFGGNISLYGTLLVNNLDNNGVPTAGAVIKPGYTTNESTPAMYDIGTSDRTFNNIYSNNFYGTFNGSLNGSIVGSIIASKLASPTTFSLAGDITSDNVLFDGQTTNGAATFSTTVSPNFISSKPLTTDTLLTDYFLMYRAGAGTNSGLTKITKQQFLSNVATVPIGSIFPYAGITAPAGYLLCDGSEVSVSTYTLLYTIVKYVYKAAPELLGIGTFALPDLRGRFPLGNDSMDNNNTVISKSSGITPIVIDAGGGSANRVTDYSADIIGAGSGSQSVALTPDNLPDHKHNLKSVAGAQYYVAGLPGAPVDLTADKNLGMPNSSSGYGMRNTGGVDSPTIGQSFTVLNPYQTLNYIIFTGVI